MFLLTIWRGILFVVLCFFLFLLGVAKGVVFGPPSFVVLVVGHAAVTIGLWPVHVVMTYYSVAKAKKLGPSARVLSFLCLPVPLLLWPLTVLIGSILVGLGYGFITPLVSTFEAVGADTDDKAFHALVDGSWSTLKGSCTVVRDFTDLSHHSFTDYLKDFREKEPKNGHPYDIKITEIPGCVLVAVLGVLLDVPAVALVAAVKVPIMLIKGWQRLVKDLWGRQGPFLEAVCVPFAGLAIVLWPLVVIFSFLASVFASPFLGIYGAVIVYQERSVKRGLAYIVNVIAQFDEYSNDVIHLNEGSCFPRPEYRDHEEAIALEVGSPKTFAELQSELQKAHDQQLDAPGQQPQPALNNHTESLEGSKPGEKNEDELKQPSMNEGGSSSPSSLQLSKSASQSPNIPLSTSKSLKRALQEVNVVQVWDDLFKGFARVGPTLVREGAITATEIEEYLHASKKDRSKKLTVGLPALTSLDKVFYTAKVGVPGILLYDGTEITPLNKPQDKLGLWLFEPLVVLKEQVRIANLTQAEEKYMQKWILTSGDPAMMASWDNGGVEPEGNIRRGELQAICRRLQGIATSYTRLPTFPRRYQKYLYSLLTFAQSQQKVPSERAPQPQGDDAV